MTRTAAPTSAAVPRTTSYFNRGAIAVSAAMILATGPAAATSTFSTAAFHNHTISFASRGLSSTTPRATEPRPTMTYIQSRLHAQADAIDPSVIERSKDLLDRLVSTATIEPSVLADGDGGVVFFWSCGPLSVELDVDPDELYYARARDAETTQVNEWFEDPFPETDLRDAIARLSHRAESVRVTSV